MNCGQVIREIRRRKNMSQSQLSMLTGIKQPNLSRIESGLVESTHKTIERIAEAMGVTADTLYDEAKAMEITHAPKLLLRELAGALRDNLLTIPADRHERINTLIARAEEAAR